MKIIIKTAVFCISTMLLLGCSTNKLTVDKFSGFLEDYSVLRPAKKDKDIRVYLRSGVDWQQYNNLIISKVVIVTTNDMSFNQTEMLTEVAERFREKLIGHLSKEFTIVEHPIPHTLRLEAAIASVYESYDDLRGYQFIPVAAVITGVSRTTGITKKKARMMSEGKLVDASTNMILAEAIDLKEGKIIQKQGQAVTLDDLEPVLEVWAARITKNLVLLKNKVSTIK